MAGTEREDGSLVREFLVGRRFGSGWGREEDFWGIGPRLPLLRDSGSLEVARPPWVRTHGYCMTSLRDWGRCPRVAGVNLGATQPNQNGTELGIRENTNSCSSQLRWGGADHELTPPHGLRRSKGTPTLDFRLSYLRPLTAARRDRCEIWPPTQFATARSIRIDAQLAARPPRAVPKEHCSLGQTLRPQPQESQEFR